MQLASCSGLNVNFLPFKECFAQNDGGLHFLKNFVVQKKQHFQVTSYSLQPSVTLHNGWLELIFEPIPEIPVSYSHS